MNVNYLANLSFYIPELTVVLTMVGLLFAEVTYKDEEKKRDGLFVIGYLGLGFSLLALIKNLAVSPTALFTNAVVIDPFSTSVKILMVLGTLFCLYLGKQSKDIYVSMKSEFAILAVGVLIGGMLLVSANNLLTVYLGIETLSILAYVLASFKKNDDRSSEAGLKYVIYGGVASGVMLFGMSHIFGLLGSIQFANVGALIGGLDNQQMAILIISFVFFFVGLGYKISCIPFHMWAPDVYEGSPIPVTTFFSLIPKIAGIVAILRITMIFFGDVNSVMHFTWVGLLQVVAALTMIVGNITAIGQKSVKRMLAYSSIAHAGFLLLGVVVVDEIGASSILFYLVVYLFMGLGAFYLTSFISDKYGNDHFERFSGLGFRYPLMAVMMAITLFSLVGLPPFAGFIAKFNIFYAAIEKKFYTLVLIGGISSVISLYFYTKLVRFMFFVRPESEEKIEGLSFLNQGLICAFSVPVVFLGLFWSGIMERILNAKIFLIQ
jgi:NADH-quinone oxidoreductase subunit N